VTSAERVVICARITTPLMLSDKASDVLPLPSGCRHLAIALVARKSMPPVLQQNLVDWWRENVSVRHGAGQGTEGSKNADRRSLISIEAAEDISGISHQKVSKWRGYLKGDRDEYRSLFARD
jgi:hypothetical protein